jgi:NADH dehydrogenase (ubiquinone) Fe-S protein 3
MLTKIYSDLERQIPFLLYQNFKNENCITIMSDKLIFCSKYIKNHIGMQFKVLSCISGVDLLQENYRFSIVYEFLSLVYNSRLRVKLFLDEHVFVPSLIDIYINANWWEREIWDLYGLYFENHSDLRRILNDYSFEGYPMRKDFPLSGFGEVRYDQNKKVILFEALQLSQEYRTFIYSNLN